jgi:hypothetical protein
MTSAKLLVSNSSTQQHNASRGAVTAVTVRAFHASSPWDVLPYEDLQSAANDDSKKEGGKERDDEHDGLRSDPAVSVSVQGLDFNLALLQ